MDYIQGLLFDYDNLITSSREAEFRRIVLGKDKSILKPFIVSIDSINNKGYCGEGVYQENGYIGYIPSALKVDLGTLYSSTFVRANLFTPVLETGNSNVFKIENNAYDVPYGTSISNLEFYIGGIVAYAENYRLLVTISLTSNIDIQRNVYQVDKVRNLDEKTTVKEYASTSSDVIESEIGDYLASTKFVDSYIDDFKYWKEK